MPDVEFPLDDRNPAIANDARASLGISEGDRFAIINPGAAWPNKRWPPVYFAEVARGLAERHGLRSLVLWGPGEEHIAQTVVTAADGVAAVSPQNHRRRSRLVDESRGADDLGRYGTDAYRRSLRVRRWWAFSVRPIRSATARGPKTISSRRDIARARVTISGSAASPAGACSTSRRARCWISPRGGWHRMRETLKRKTKNEKRKVSLAERLARWRVPLGFACGGRRPLPGASDTAVAGDRRRDRCCRRDGAHMGGRASRQRARGDAVGSLPVHAAPSLRRLRGRCDGCGRRVCTARRRTSSSACTWQSRSVQRCATKKKTCGRNSAASTRRTCSKTVPPVTRPFSVERAMKVNKEYKAIVGLRGWRPDSGGESRPEQRLIDGKNQRQPISNNCSYLIE